MVVAVVGSQAFRTRDLTNSRKNVRSHRSPLPIRTRNFARTQCGPVARFATLVGDAEVDEGRGDVSVPKPVLHVRNIPPGVGEMHADRVPQCVRVPAIERKLRRGCVDVAKPVDLST